MNDDVLEDSEHIESPLCWCKPDLILEGVPGKFGDVWIHKAPGDELCPACVIAEAIADAFSHV